MKAVIESMGGCYKEGSFWLKVRILEITAVQKNIAAHSLS